MSYDIGSINKVNFKRLLKALLCCFVLLVVATKMILSAERCYFLHKTVVLLFVP